MVCVLWNSLITLPLQCPTEPCPKDDFPKGLNFLLFFWLLSLKISQIRQAVCQLEMLGQTWCRHPYSPKGQKLGYKYVVPIYLLAYRSIQNNNSLHKRQFTFIVFSSDKKMHRLVHLGLSLRIPVSSFSNEIFRRSI